MDETKAIYFVLGCFAGGMAYAIYRNRQSGDGKTIDKIRQEASDAGYNEAGDQFMQFLGRCEGMGLTAGQVKYALLNNGEVR